LPAVRKGGEEIHVELSLSPIEPVVDTNGGGRFVLAIIRDITERKRAEERLREANRHLEELAALRADFTAMLAHEIGSPLATIRGFLDMLATGELGPADQTAVLARSRSRPTG
jgi:signal transduction histidine kinase